MHMVVSFDNTLLAKEIRTVWLPSHKLPPHYLLWKCVIIDELYDHI